MAINFIRSSAMSWSRREPAAGTPGASMDASPLPEIYGICSSSSKCMGLLIIAKVCEADTLVRHAEAELSGGDSPQSHRVTETQRKTWRQSQLRAHATGANLGTQRSCEGKTPLRDANGKLSPEPARGTTFQPDGAAGSGGPRGQVRGRRRSRRRRELVLFRRP